MHWTKPQKSSDGLSLIEHLSVYTYIFDDFVTATKLNDLMGNQRYRESIWQILGKESSTDCTAALLAVGKARLRKAKTGFLDRRFSIFGADPWTMHAIYVIVAVDLVVTAFYIDGNYARSKGFSLRPAVDLHMPIKRLMLSCFRSIWMLQGCCQLSFMAGNHASFFHGHGFVTVIDRIIVILVLCPVTIGS